MPEPPSIDTLICLLQQCRKTKNLAYAKRVLAHICMNGLEAKRAVGNYIVPMFVECGSVCDAQQVFNRLVYRNEHSWTSLMLAYTECGLPQHAFNLYKKMQEDCILPSSYTFMALLKACARLQDVERGREVHVEIAKKGFENNVFVGNTLVDMYVKCGSIAEAQEVFNKLPVRDGVTWNALLAGYAEHGPGLDALKCFEQMQLEGSLPGPVTFVCILKACGSIGAIDKGREVHTRISQKGFEIEVFLGNGIVDMYAKCGSLTDAHEAFDKLPGRDIVSWTALIAGYAGHGAPQKVLEYFDRMQLEGFSPDSVVFPSVLKACGNIGAIDKAREIHADITQKGFETDVFVGSSLVDMYVRFGSLQEAREVFDKLPARNVTLWNALIAGYAEHGFVQQVLQCFEQMQLEGVFTDAVTLVCMLKACSSVGALDKGQEIHFDIAQRGLERDVYVSNALIDMYAKCGSFAEARDVFDKLPVRDIVSWTALTVGYAQHGHGQEALRCFEQMQLEGITPDAMTFVCVVKDMNAKCGSVAQAREVFDNLLVHDVMSWNAVIAGYTEFGPDQEALNCFEQMQLEGVSPDAVTFACILKACGNIGALDKGREIHVESAQKGFESDLSIGKTLVDMYAKCGSLWEAREVFSKLPAQDVMSWNAIIKAYGMNHEVDMAVQCFVNMQEQGVMPDDFTFTCLLTACSRARLVLKGQEIFNMMTKEFGIVPTKNHFTCMVDLLAQSGQFHEAENFVEAMPCAPSWTALLSACKIYGDAELGLRCFQQLVHMNPECAAPYVLMAETYVSAGRWDDAYRIEEIRKGACAKKKPASAWIEVNKKVHEFVVGKKSKEISALLENLSSRMEEEGHVPSVNLVLRPMSDEKKILALCKHVEKLAIAFGLLKTPQGQTLRVTKNLRMCSDCHNTSKFISKIEKREIFVRDVYRIHHFKDGLCSCCDMC